MPFGLSGAQSSFQRLMDKVCHGLPFVTTYLDDVLVHSANDKDHEKHLREVFQRFTQAGLTLRGMKCDIGMSKVAYLGHVFSSEGMKPDPQKISAVKKWNTSTDVSGMKPDPQKISAVKKWNTSTDVSGLRSFLGLASYVFSSEGMKPDPQKISAVKKWNTPTDVSGLRSFLGLASYYRQYIQRFTDITAPLHHLTSKGVAFHWDTACQSAFEELKVELTKTPVLAFPFFSQAAPPFHCKQMPASEESVVLEQDGHVIAYASRVLCRA